MSYSGLGQPMVIMEQGPAACGRHVRCSPAGALVQLGGVLVLHVPHVVLRGPLPILKEQLLGLTATLTLLCFKNMTVPTTLRLSQSLGVYRESINSSSEGKEVLTVEYIYSLRFETVQVSCLELADILNINRPNLV